MLTLLASSRPAFSGGSKTLTFTVPEIAAKGNMLVIVMGYDTADSFALPDGWTQLVAIAGTAKLAAIGRMVDDGDPGTIVVAVTLAAKDWLGQLLVYNGSNPNIILEASAHANFAASVAPAAPAVACQQAIDLELGLWFAAGAAAIAAPAGFTAIDSYSTAIAASETMLIAEMVAGATGNLAAAAAACAASTGTVASLVLREQPPITPAVLFDPIPGNIGLLGKDNRPARESTLP